MVEACGEGEAAAGAGAVTVTIIEEWHAVTAHVPAEYTGS